MQSVGEKWNNTSACSPGDVKWQPWKTRYRQKIPTCQDDENDRQCERSCPGHWRRRWIVLSDIKVAEWIGMSAFFTLLLIDAPCFPLPKKPFLQLLLKEGEDHRLCFLVLLARVQSVKSQQRFKQDTFFPDFILLCWCHLERRSSLSVLEPLTLSHFGVAT